MYFKYLFNILVYFSLTIFIKFTLAIDTCIFDKNNQYKIVKDKYYKDVMNQYSWNNFDDPYSIFFGECQEEKIKEGYIVSVENILGLKYDKEMVNSKTIKKRYDYEESVNNDKCIAMVSTSGLGNPYSRELTGIINADIHKGYLIDPEYFGHIDCTYSNYECKQIIQFSIELSDTASYSYTKGNSYSNTLTIGESNSQSENKQNSDSIANSIEESISKTTSHEDSKSVAQDISKTLTITQEHSLQNTKSDETNKSHTESEIIDVQKQFSINSESSLSNEISNSNTDETNTGNNASGNAGLNIKGIFSIGGEYQHSWGSSNSKTFTETNGWTINNGTSQSNTEGKSNETSNTKGSSHSESTTDSNSDSTSEAITNGKTTTESRSDSDSYARTNGNSKTNTYTETIDIGNTKSKESSEATTIGNDSSESIGDTKTKSKSISFTREIPVEPGFSYDIYNSYPATILNVVYQCENENWTDENNKYEYVLAHIATLEKFDYYNPSTKPMLNEMKNNNKTIYDFDEISPFIRSNPQAIFGEVEFIDRIKIEQNLYNTINFDDITNSIDVSLRLDQETRLNALKIDEELGLVFTDDKNERGNYKIRRSDIGDPIWETYTYGFNDNKPYFKLDLNGHGNIYASGFLGYDKNVYAEEFKSVNYNLDPTRDKAFSKEFNEKIYYLIQNSNGEFEKQIESEFLSNNSSIDDKENKIADDKNKEVNNNNGDFNDTKNEGNNDNSTNNGALENEKYDTMYYQDFLKKYKFIKSNKIEPIPNYKESYEWTCKDLNNEKLSCNWICIIESYLQYDEMFEEIEDLLDMFSFEIDSYDELKDTCEYEENNCGCEGSFYKSNELTKRLSYEDIEIIKGENVIWSTVGAGFQKSKVGYGNDKSSYKLVLSQKRTNNNEKYTFNGISIFDEDKVMIWASNSKAGNVQVDKSVVNGFYLPEFYGYPFLNSDLTKKIHNIYSKDVHVSLGKYKFIENNYLMFNGCFNSLEAGYGIQSKNKRFSLILQESGNLIFKDNKVTIWESKTANVWYGQKPYTMHLDIDGTLVILDRNGYIVFRTYSSSIWSENSNGIDENGIDENGIENEDNIYRLEVLNIGTFRIMDKNGKEVWNMWENKGMNKYITYSEVNYLPLCDNSYRRKFLTYMDSSDPMINHILVGERVMNVGYVENKDKIGSFETSSNMLLTRDGIYFEDLDSKEFDKLNPITQRNPRIVEARLSNEGEFACFDAYNNKLFTSGIKGPMTNENEAYYLFITFNYEEKDNEFKCLPSYINIIHNTTNELIWSYPPLVKREEIHSDDKEEYYIRTLDGLIYDKETHSVVSPDLGSPIIYRNKNVCVLLRPDGVYAYGESKPFFEVSNSKKLYLNSTDGGIYVDGQKYKEIQPIKNLPTKMYCDIVDENYSIILEDSKNNIVWQYPSINKYSISNIQRNNTLLVDRKLMYNSTYHCINFEKTGLFLNDANIYDNSQNDTSSNVILSSIDGALFMIDVNEGNKFSIMNKNGEAENSIYINNPLNHEVRMRCSSESSVEIIDIETNKILWSKPVVQYEILNLNSILYLNQELIKKEDGEKYCMKLENDGLHIFGEVEPFSQPVNEDIMYVKVTENGIINDKNEILVDFKLSSDLTSQKDKLKVSCEVYNGIFSTVVAIEENIIWRYPKYVHKYELKTNDLLYNNEILYDKNENACLTLTNGNLIFKDRNGDDNIIEKYSFNNDQVNYIKIENNQIVAFDKYGVTITNKKINNKYNNDNIIISCYEYNGKYRFNIENDHSVVYSYPEFIEKYELIEDEYLYNNEYILYSQNKYNTNLSILNCFKINENNIYVFDSEKPFYKHAEKIKYIQLTSEGIKINDELVDDFKVKKTKSSPLKMYCKDVYSIPRMMIESEDKSNIYWMYPKIEKKTSLITGNNGINNKNLLYEGEKLYYSDSDEVCLIYRNGNIYSGNDIDIIFKTNFEYGNQLYINKYNKLLIDNRNNQTDFMEVYNFNVPNKVEMKCEKVGEKNSVVVRNDNNEIVYYYPQYKYEFLTSINHDKNNKLYLYDSLVTKEGEICLTIKENGIYSNEKLIKETKHKIKYLNIDSLDGSIGFDSGEKLLDFSDSGMIDLPTKMSCIKENNIKYIKVTDSKGKVIYNSSVEDINNNDSSTCNILNYMTNEKYKNKLCIGDVIKYRDRNCIYFDETDYSIRDNYGEVIFNNKGKHNLEMDKDGLLKLGNETLLNFSMYKDSFPLILKCGLINNELVTYVSDNNNNYLWMHRPERRCKNLISNDNNCNNLYKYEYLYNNSGKVIMHFLKDRIEGIDEYVFNEETLFLEINNNGKLFTNDRIIYETKNKIYSPYLFKCNESNYYSEDVGLVCRLTNSFEEKEYSIPEKQRRNRSVWGVKSINSKNERFNIMERGDTLDCGKYGLTVRKDSIVIRDYLTGETNNYLEGLNDIDIGSAILGDNGLITAYSITDSRELGSIGTSSTTDLSPFTLKCGNNRDIKIYDKNNSVIYTINFKSKNNESSNGKLVSLKSTNGSKYKIGTSKLGEIEKVVMNSSSQQYTIWYWTEDGQLKLTDSDKKPTEFCLTLNKEEVSGSLSITKCSNAKYKFYTKKNIKDYSYIEIFNNKNKPVVVSGYNLCISNGNPLKTYYCKTPASSYPGLKFEITYYNKS